MAAHDCRSLIIPECLSIDISPFLCCGRGQSSECAGVFALDVAAGLWRMFHFKGLGTVSAVYGCVCVCDLSGILINLVNEHQAAFCVCVVGL